MWSSSTLRKLASIEASVAIRRLRPPPSADAARAQVVLALQLHQAPPDRLGVAAQQGRDVFDPAVAELGGLDGRVPPTIALVERIEESFHQTLHSGGVAVHRSLAEDFLG